MLETLCITDAQVENTVVPLAVAMVMKMMMTTTKVMDMATGFQFGTCGIYGKNQVVNLFI